MTIGRRIYELRTALGRSQQWLADQLGVKRSAVTQWENGTSNPVYDRLNTIARALGTTPEYLVSGRRPAAAAELEQQASDRKVATPPQLPLAATLPPDADLATARHTGFPEAPGRVPVYGAAQGGNGGGDFVMNGQVIDTVRRPPGVGDAPGVFALYVTGDSCSPKYDPGDLIFIHPGRPVSVGGWVLVELVPADEAETHGPALVKRLVRRTAEKVVLEQLNPAKQIVIPMAKVRRIMRVLSNAEMFGV